jgi:hypothetical protein
LAPDARSSPKEENNLKLYLDDNRPAPEDWVLAKTADEAIAILRQGGVTEMSLDYDLGDPLFGTGLDVLDWLERALAERRVQRPRLIAHSGSALGRRRLEAAIALIEERFTVMPAAPRAGALGGSGTFGSTEGMPSIKPQ